MTLIVTMIVASVVAGCSSSDSAIRDRIAESIAPVRDSVDFDIILPAYLPEGTQKGPIWPWLTGKDNNDGVSLTFYPNDPDNEANVPTAKRPARIEITEGKADGPAPTPDPNLEEIYGVKWEWFQFRGLDVFVRRSEDPGSAYMALGARVGKVDVGLSASWSGDWSGDGSPPVVELTPDMEKEFFKIFESMLDH